MLVLGVLQAASWNAPMSGHGTAGARTTVAATLQDTLAHAAEARDPQGTYPSLLERMVAEALQGNSTLLDSRLARALPAGAQWNAWLDNGRAQLPLRANMGVQGETISANVPLTPAWEPILALPVVRELDAQRSSLQVQALPLHRAVGWAAQAGLQAEVEEQLPGGGRVNITVFAPVGNVSGGGPGVSLSLLDAGQRTLIAQPAAGNRSLFLGVEETQGRPIAAGTPLLVRLPPGFWNVTCDAAVNPAWNSIVVSGNSTYGWSIEAHLASALSSSLQQLQINASAPSSGKLSLLTAALANGTQARLSAVHVASSGSTSSGALPPGRGPWLTLPALAPFSSLAHGGLALAYPDDASRTVNVTRVTLTAQSGLHLLDTAGVSPASGWILTGDKLEWTGSRSLSNDQALDWRFDLRADAPAQPQNGGVAGLGLDLLNGSTANLVQQRYPGLFTTRFAAHNATQQGFNDTAGSGLARLNGTHQNAVFAGDLAYNTTANPVVQAAASDLARGLAESSLSLDAGSARLGGNVTLRWNLSRVVEELGVQGTQFKCYTSTSGAWSSTANESACTGGSGLGWQFRAEAPNVTLRIGQPSPLVNGDLAVAQSFAARNATDNATWTVPLTSLLGTHPVELRAEFRTHNTTGAELVQRVSLLRSFEVTSETGGEAQAPTYLVLVQAWLPDWA